MPKTKRSPARRTPRPKNETQRIIGKALKVLKKKGWTQNQFENYKGQVCAIGALNTAATGASYVRDWEFPYYDARDVLKFAAGVPDDRGVPEWNDAPGRTKAEVLEVFKVAYTIAGDL